MQSGRTSSAGRAAIASALLAIALLLTPAAALGAISPSAGNLSQRLAELARPAVRSLPRGAQSRRLGLPRSGAGSLRRQGNRVLVDVSYDRGAAAGVASLRAAGARIVNVSRRYQTVTAAVPPADLRRVGALSRVASVKEVLAPLLFATCPSGNVVSEGDQQLRAAEARSALGVDGSGVTVGILSDSFDQATEAADESGPVATHAFQDVSSGDLPGISNPCGHTSPVNVLEKFEPELFEQPSDEGRGMTQIVHDLAPGAHLAFASAFNGLFSFAENIERLAAPVASGGAGAEVLADDVAYLDEPFFQEGPAGLAARHVSERGADYFSAAGNDNLFEEGSGREIASWEAPKFRDAGSCGVPALDEFSEEVKEEEEAANKKLEEELEEPIFPELGLNPIHCMDFNPSPSETDKEFEIEVEEKETLFIDLQWAEPWQGVKTDIDAFLLGEGGEILEFSAEDNVNTSEEPFELIAWENPSNKPAKVQLVINKYTEGAPNPRLKFGLLENGFGVSKVEYPESKEGDVVGPTIFGHSGDAQTISVAAVPFSDSSEAEEYSSRGPVTHYFGPANGVDRAAPLGSPEFLAKPDIAASDCVATTFFASEDPFGKWRFCGTSAAAPHAAAVAALMRQKNPGATPAQIRSALASSARPVGSFGPNVVGAGLIDALGAVNAVPAPPPSQAAAVSPPPDTFIRRHPKHVVRTRKPKARLRFRFASSPPGASFQCKLERGSFRSCGARFVKKFKPGKHVITVRAVDAAGQVDPTPAIFRFRVKRIQRVKHSRRTKHSRRVKRVS
jgi:subtilase family protein